MTEVAICFGGNPVEFTQLQDGDFLKSIRWIRDAPKSAVQAAKTGDVETFCGAIRTRRCTVHRRSGLKKVATFAAERPSLWYPPEFDTSARTDALVEIWRAFGSRMKRPKGKSDSGKKRDTISLASANGNGAVNGNGKGSKSKRRKRSDSWAAGESALAEWLAAADSGVPLLPLDMLVLNEMLLAIGRELSTPLCWQLWRTACCGAMTLAELLPEPVGSSMSDEQKMVIAGELPLQAGLLFGGMKGAAGLRLQGARLLTAAILDGTDTDGTPHAERIERLATWLVPLVRAKQWADGFGEKLFTAEGDERFRDLIRTVAPMCRPDGRIALVNGDSDGEAPSTTTRLLASASRSAGLSKKSSPMRYLSAVEKLTSSGRPAKRPSLRSVAKVDSKESAKKKQDGDRPVAQSDWAQLACLRSDWSLAADTVVVAHDGPLPRVDLSAGGVPLISGIWDLELSIDDQPVDASGDWSCSCWFSDADADYIEIQNSLDDGTVIDRQILLSRTDHFLLFADCILSGNREARIEYAQRLPVLSDVSVEADVPTRECRLRQNGLSARVFPLALEADRIRSTPGSFGGEEGQLELRQSAVGGVYAPLLIDWSPKHKRAYAEWRRLTVAEDGRKLTSADASGHRLRLGNQHLFVFRNLTKGHFSRSVLGQHTRQECVIGRFGKNGKVSPILLVE